MFNINLLEQKNYKRGNGNHFMFRSFSVLSSPFFDILGTEKSDVSGEKSIITNVRWAI